MKFEYFAELKEGYKPVMPVVETEEKTEMSFIIEAKNRATADRMVKALLKEAANVERYSGICIE